MLAFLDICVSEPDRKQTENPPGGEASTRQRARSWDKIIGPQGCKEVFSCHEISDWKGLWGCPGGYIGKRYGGARSG